MNCDKTLLGLAVGAAVMAALSALVFSFEALAIPALYAIGVGIFAAISKSWQRIVPGVVAVIVGIMALIGALNLSFNESSFDAAWFNSHAAGLAVTANLIVALVPVAFWWGTLRLWLAASASALVLILVVVAMAAGDAMDDHSAAEALAVGFLSLAAAVPSVILLRAD